MDGVDHALYAALWLSFAAGHSLLAGAASRAVFGPVVGGGHRLAYNLVAVLHIAAVWGIGRFVLADGAARFALPGMVQAVLWVMAAAGAVIVAVALRGYDLGRFGGLTQWRGGADIPEDEALTTAGLNRFVRHPLYLGVILLLTGLVDGPFPAATALWATLYIVIGARIEERRLVARHGEAYRRYQRQVPFLMPWKGRVY